MATKEILPLFYEDLMKKSFLTAGIIAIVFLAMYLKGRQLRTRL